MIFYEKPEPIPQRSSPTDPKPETKPDSLPETRSVKPEMIVYEKPDPIPDPKPEKVLPDPPLQSRLLPEITQET